MRSWIPLGEVGRCPEKGREGGVGRVDTSPELFWQLKYCSSNSEVYPVLLYLFSFAIAMWRRIFSKENQLDSLYLPQTHTQHTGPCSNLLEENWPPPEDSSLILRVPEGCLFKRKKELRWLNHSSHNGKL